MSNNASKLTRMANQIATFFETQPKGDKPGLVAAHLVEFWTMQMRRDLQAAAREDGHGLSPLALEAVAQI